MPMPSKLLDSPATLPPFRSAAVPSESWTLEPRAQVRCSMPHHPGKWPVTLIEIGSSHIDYIDWHWDWLRFQGVSGSWESCATWKCRPEIIVLDMSWMPIQKTVESSSGSSAWTCIFSSKAAISANLESLQPLLSLLRLNRTKTISTRMNHKTHWPLANVYTLPVNPLCIIMFPIFYLAFQGYIQFSNTLILITSLEMIPSYHHIEQPSNIPMRYPLKWHFSPHLLLNSRFSTVKPTAGQRKNNDEGRRPGPAKRPLRDGLESSCGDGSGSL